MGLGDFIKGQFIDVIEHVDETNIAGTISSETPSGEDSIAKLREYKKLLDEGVLSQDEFDALKKKALKI